MAEPIRWAYALVADNPTFQIENASRTGGPSLSGKEQVVSSPGARWTSKFDAIVGSRGEVNTFRAIAAHLQGRATTVLIEPFELNWSPASLKYGVAFHYCKFSDGSTFSDGTVFFMHGTYSTTVNAQSVLDSAMQIVCDPAPTAGQFFGIENAAIGPDSPNFAMHVIDSVTPLGGINYSITFRPPLRHAYAAGWPLNFERPTCEMRLAADLSGALTRTRVNYSSVPVEFVEAF